MDQARSETETYALHLKSAQEQLKKGLTNKMDVLEVESRLSQAESTLAKAKGDLDLSLLQLSRITRQKVLAEDLSRNLLNRTPGWQIKDFSSYEPVALANNLKIGEAMQRKNIAEKLVDIAHAQYYPTVELLASYSDTDSAQITSYPNYSKVMLSMSYPLYDGGLRASVGREAYERVKASEFEEQQTKLDVANRIQELVVLYKSSMIAAQSLEKSYRSSNAYLEAAELGNKVGLKSYIDVLDAEFERFRVYSSLVKTRRDLLSVYFELKIMLGESIDRLLFELSSLEAAHESKR
jgi:outer membrane protein TolC